MSDEPTTDATAFNFSDHPREPLTFESLKRAAQSMREMAQNPPPIDAQRMPPIGPTLYKEYEAKGWIRNGRYTREYFAHIREGVRAEAEARGISVEQLLDEKLPEYR